MIWIIAVAEEWSGSLGGVGSTDKSMWVWHHSFPPNIGPDYTIDIYEVLTFSDVTVLGHSGAITMGLYLKADITGLTGCWIILSGTGGLAHLYGQGTLWGSGSPYSYTGQVHF